MPWDNQQQQQHVLSPVIGIIHIRDNGTMERIHNRSSSKVGVNGERNRLMLVPEEARVQIKTGVTAAYNFVVSVQACCGMDIR
jgi:hypothetical protein